MILTITYKDFTFNVHGKQTDDGFEIDKLFYKGVDFTEVILAVIDEKEIELLCLEKINKKEG